MYSCTVRLELREVLEVKEFQEVQGRGERLPKEHRPLLRRVVGVVGIPVLSSR